ncbi:uncharacterized protein LOC111603225 isoform X2 [Drosophila hydei]|uniref:Uncharacterized protein LOC111603225 isoform X2 n=1 Tax=Drosophila hydei TaxID=7224 RepID=A0A6J1MCD1_DROHY|nr:uncharacterized protein LOC111603225 isoform X2 [Drosophila hydei]
MIDGSSKKHRACPNSKNTRRQAIPILYTRGSHYEVGFDMGRTFGSMIRNFRTQCYVLNETFLPLYNTPKGKQIYEETLASVKASFPQYVRELEGVADGAEVDFVHLFLMQMDEILPQNMCPAPKHSSSCGCSSIVLNQKHCAIQRMLQ